MPHRPDRVVRGHASRHVPFRNIDVQKGDNKTQFIQVRPVCELRPPDMMTYMYCYFLHATRFINTGSLSLPALFTCTSLKLKPNTYVGVYVCSCRVYIDTVADYYYSTYYVMYLDVS